MCILIYFRKLSSKRRKVIKMMYNSLERKCFCGLFYGFAAWKYKSMASIGEHCCYGDWPIMGYFKGPTPKSTLLGVKVRGGRFIALLNFCKISFHSCQPILQNRFTLHGFNIGNVFKFGKAGIVSLNWTNSTHTQS